VTRSSGLTITVVEAVLGMMAVATLAVVIGVAVTLAVATGVAVATGAVVTVAVTGVVATGRREELWDGLPSVASACAQA
jgi:Flp pilus assembly protein TadB